MKKFMAVVWAILLFGLVTNAAIDSKKGEDRFLLTRNAPVRISVETGWQRDGLIPVRIDIPGLHLDLWMDGEGRVFDDARLESGKTGKIPASRQGLFSLDKTSGQLQAGGQTLSGQVYEQNPLRTRLRLNNLALALQLDIQKGRAALDLNGIIIPARMRLGQEVDGMRELEIGELGEGGEGRLFLDAGQGRLFFEDGRTRPAVKNQQTNRLCWAEKQK